MQQVAVTADIPATPDSQPRAAAAEAQHPQLPLVVRNLSFVVAGKRIIDDVSFALESNTRTLILGPNGAGKSVLLRLCHGLLQPTAGQISWGGLPATEAVRRQVMVFQRPVLLRRSVAANLDHVLKIKRVPRSQRRRHVAVALSRSGLGDLADRPARTLSGGEQQRLAIARAWVVRPDVLLLDEPTSNLDPAATLAVEELIRAVGIAGTKIIMTTHDIAQAHRLAAEVMFLHRGRLLEHCPAAEFLRRPNHPAAVGFIEGHLPV